MTLLEFECQDHRFALPIGSVRRVVPGAWPMPLPGAPVIVLGILNVGTEVVTVLDFFSRVALPFSAIQVRQQMIVVSIADLLVGLIVDSTLGVVEWNEDNSSHMPDRVSGADFVDAVMRLDDGLCIIVDPEKFLFGEERALVQDALKEFYDEKH